MPHWRLTDIAQTQDERDVDITPLAVADEYRQAGVVVAAVHRLPRLRVPTAVEAVLRLLAIVQDRMVADLHAAGCDLVTITQYLRPSPRHHPVMRWVKPEEFVELGEVAEAMGFAGVLSGPLVRSSYRAGRLYEQAIAARTP